MKRKHAAESSDDDSSGSDYDVEDTVAPKAAAGPKSNKDKDGFEVVSQDPGETLLEISLEVAVTRIQTYHQKVLSEYRNIFILNYLHFIFLTFSL